jgi:hypothetical protein
MSDLSSADKNEIQIELDAAELMVKDLERLFKSYAKKALIAKQKRETKQDRKGFLQYETKDDLITAYGYADIDDETYARGLDYFNNYKEVNTSAVEKHRENIKGLIRLWKGTISELSEEINPSAETENDLQRREREEREARLSDMQLSDALDRRV